MDTILEKCKRLSLNAIAGHLEQALEQAKSSNWSFEKMLDDLLEREIERRTQNRIALRFKQSKLAEKITIDQFDFSYHPSRKENKNRILSLMNQEFIREHADVILIGNPGVGKTYLAKCIAYTATQAQTKVLFTTAMDMINQLVAAEADKSLLKKLQTYQTPDLLVVDELGYLPLGTQGSNLFFQVISARHAKKSTMITTNLPFANWADIFDSTTVATAIADRLVYKSEVLIMKGESYRKKAA